MYRCSHSGFRGVRGYEYCCKLLDETRRPLHEPPSETCVTHRRCCCSCSHAYGERLTLLRFYGHAKQMLGDGCILAGLTVEPSKATFFAPIPSSDRSVVRCRLSLVFTGHALKSRFMCNLDDPATWPMEGERNPSTPKLSRSRNAK